MEIALAAVLDIALIAIFVVGIVLGVRRGFVKTLIRFAGNIAALVLAIIFSAQLGAYLNEHYIGESTRQWVVSQLTSTPSGETADEKDIDMGELVEDKPTFFTTLCDYLGISVDDISEKYKSTITENVDNARTAVIDMLAKPLSDVVSRVAAFVIIYIAGLIIVLIAWAIASAIIKIPIIRKLDGLLGGIIGAITSIVVCFVFVSIVNLAAPYAVKNMSINQQNDIVGRTVVYETMKELNPLNAFFGK